MDKRLRLAKDLLTHDGAIFVSIDDNEYPRLTLLMEEIFGESNIKTICVKMSEPTGLKMASAISAGTIPKLKEYIVIAKKDGVRGLFIDKIKKDKWDDEYRTIIDNASREEVEEVKKIRDNEKRSDKDVKRLESIIGKWRVKSVASYCENNQIEEKKLENFKRKNAWRIIQLVSIEGGVAKEVFKKRKLHSKANLPSFFSIITPKDKLYLIKGDFNITTKKPRSKVLFADDYLSVHIGDFWHDIKTTGLKGEGGVDFINGKKPLSLIRRILKTNIKKEITILDFFAGSGSTGEAVLEMNKEDGGSRQFVLCTNDESKICTKITYPRIKNAIVGYHGRISLAEISGILKLILYLTKIKHQTVLRRSLCEMPRK